MSPVRALVETWLVLDFFGDSRRSGQEGSSLTTTIFGQSFFALLFATILFPDYGTIPFAAANLSLSTLLVGISILGTPDPLLRARADELLERMAPISAWTRTLAHAAHRGFHLVLITTGIALPPGILLCWISEAGPWVLPAYLVMACATSGLLAGGLAVFVLAVNRLLGPLRGALVAGSLKALLFGGGFLAFGFCLQHLGGTAADLPFGTHAALFWPPYWGARLLHDPHGSWPFALTMVLTATTLLMTWTWLGRLPAQTRLRARSRPSRFESLDRFLTGGGPRLGLTSFISAMLYRSPGYRAMVLPLLGLPVAMVFLAFWNPDPAARLLLIGVTLQLPTVYLPILIAFLPKSDQEGTAWLFATSPNGSGLTLAREATLIALATRILLPVHVTACAAMMLSGTGTLTSLAFSTFSLGTAVIVSSLALRSMETTPFTSDESGIHLDHGQLISFALGMSLLGGAFSAIANGAIGMIVGLGMLGAAQLLLRRNSDEE